MASSSRSWDKPNQRHNPLSALIAQPPRHTHVQPTASKRWTMTNLSLHVVATEIGLHVHATQDHPGHTKKLLATMATAATMASAAATMATAAAVMATPLTPLDSSSVACEDQQPWPRT